MNFGFPAAADMNYHTLVKYLIGQGCLSFSMEDISGALWKRENSYKTCQGNLLK